jgi:hypothetical protein
VCDRHVIAGVSPGSAQSLLCVTVRPAARSPPPSVWRFACPPPLPQFSVPSAPVGLFITASITNRTFALYTTGQLDYETRSTYNVTVRVKDTGPGGWTAGWVTFLSIPVQVRGS